MIDAWRVVARRVGPWQGRARLGMAWQGEILRNSYKTLVSVWWSGEMMAE